MGFKENSVLLFRYIGLSACLLIASGCAKQQIFTRAEIPKRSTEEIYQAITNHNQDFKCLNAKGKLYFENDLESGKATVNIRMYKDSLIWMNVKKLGIEIGRTLIRPDSVFIVYRWEKLYEKGASHEFNTAYGMTLNFDLLQSFLMGNVIPPDSIHMESDLIDNHYLLTTRTDQYHIVYKTNPYNLHIMEYLLTDLSGQNMRTFLGDYQNIGAEKEISMNRLYLSDSKDYGQTKAELKFSTFNINEPKDIKFEIPSHYTEL